MEIWTGIPENAIVHWKFKGWEKQGFGIFPNDCLRKSLASKIDSLVFDKKDDKNVKEFFLVFSLEEEEIMTRQASVFFSDSMYDNVMNSLLEALLNHAQTNLNMSSVFNSCVHDIAINAREHYNTAFLDKSLKRPAIRFYRD